MLHLYQLLNKSGNSLSLSSSSTYASSNTLPSHELPLFSSSTIILPQTVCKRCGIDFDDIRSLRDHFKSHHNHGPREASTVSTDEHTNVDSPSDDDDEEEEEEEQNEDNDNENERPNGSNTVDILPEDDLDSNLIPSSQPYAYNVQPPFIPVVIRDLSEEYVYSVYRVLLSKYFQQLDHESVYWRHPSYVVHLPSVSPYLVSPGECWLVMLYRGGYFSGILAEMAASDTSSTSSSSSSFPTNRVPPQNEIKILHHKRFARYTTRRKQGGSQSAHDASAGKAANSMGAQLRRYNEQLLVQEIHTLLQSNEWSTLIKTKVTRIFVSAAKTMVGHLFDGKTLSRGDKRVYTVPFATSRPTFEEAIRVVETLSKVRNVGPYTSNEEEEKKQIYAVPIPSVASTKRTDKSNESTVVDKEITNPLLDEDDDEDNNNDDDDNHTDDEPSAQQQPSIDKNINKKKKKKRNRNKPKSKSSTAVSNNTAETISANATQPKRKVKTNAKSKDEDNDDELLNSAIATANLEANNVQIALEQQILLSNLVQETVREIAILGNRLRIPAYILARVLELPNLEGEFMQSNSNSSGNKTMNNFNFTLYSGANLGTQIENAREKLNLMDKLLAEGTLSNHDLLLTMGWDNLAAAAVVAETGLQVDWSQIQISSSSVMDMNTVNNQSSSSKTNKSKKNTHLPKDNEEQQQTRILTLQEHPAVVPLQRLPPSTTTTSSSSSSMASITTAANIPMTPLRVNAGDEAVLNSMNDKERKRMLMRMAAESRALQQQQSSSSNNEDTQ